MAIFDEGVVLDIYDGGVTFSLLSDENTRVDALVSSILGLSRTQVQKNIRSENLSVNGKILTKCSFSKFSKGDVFEFEADAPEQVPAEPEEIPLDIVFENEEFIIVNKPAGLLVHPGNGHPNGTMLNGIINYLNLQDKPKNDPNFRAGLVHRIDKDTSGLLVVAKTEKTLTELQEKFSRHDIVREYTCIVWGKLKETKGTVETFHGRDPANRLRFSPNVKNGRKAVTHYEVVEEFKYASLLKITLETGRTHQIRMHMNYLGHPILNDELYGGSRKSPDPVLNKLLAASGRQLLHAGTLGFTLSGREFLFTSPLAEDIKTIKDHLENISFIQV
ncbi:RluA family pseudouridine synthase [bacterium]|nr:RluA family pseudouridine synthase [bacterium]MBP5591823.1 RluA family pseudouridine synthase [bacterium]